MADKIPKGTTTEMETFLPKDESSINGNVTTYKVTKENDLEAANGDFDPFKARVLDHPVSNCDTLTHLLKASLGTGILSMPAAFKASGLVLGIFATIVVSIICTHCAYILVASAHELYKKTGKPAMSFAEVAEEACLRGPKWGRKFAWVARQTVLWGIFATYFATCSCYTVIIAKNFLYVTEHYWGENSVDLRAAIALLLVPLILLAFVPNLKYLAPVSMVANGCMAVGLGITFYYLVQEIPSFTERPAVVDVTTLPVCISVVIFAIEAIGVVMPLENNMSTPRSFIGICGVLNQGMSFVTLVYIILGFFGYLKYGEETKDSITYNLPREAIAAQAVNVLVGIAVFCTYGLQFYVCLDIAWSQMKEKFAKRETLANYGLRTVLVTLSVLIAVAVPTIVPFVSLIGAFCFSILGLMCPVFIEVLTFWDKGFGPGNWKIVKNVIIVLTGCLALIFGSKSAIQDIIKLF
ncbi:proton-coupled amino acid transporter-like protein pathetic [Tribolium madens]|uniref:proton-coupled amino acid transporter-like protein pathetic n=1 Tax=Tribolium madens TaxID=41895 RepID=UPI001CF727D0|nr:proton-coupled amino acid transporter-like protein pathetic [Tribolium madens]